MLCNPPSQTTSCCSLVSRLSLYSDLVYIVPRLSLSTRLSSLVSPLSSLSPYRAAGPTNFVLLILSPPSDILFLSLSPSPSHHTYNLYIIIHNHNLSCIHTHTTHRITPHPPTHITTSPLARYVEFDTGNAAAEAPKPAEWQRSASVADSDGFDLTRSSRSAGVGAVSAKILLHLMHDPAKFELKKELAEMVGMFHGTRHDVIAAMWQYVKNNNLQDQEEPEWINCDAYMQRIFPSTPRIRFTEIPTLLSKVLMPLSPVVLQYTIPMELGQHKRRSLTTLSPKCVRLTCSSPRSSVRLMSRERRESLC